jgi:hypothetical protein
MHGEFSVMGLYLLLAIAVLFSTIMVTIGRRVPAPASRAAYGTAVAIVVAHPLLAQTYARALDHAVGVVGAGLLLDHVAFMAQFCGLLLTLVLATRQWAARHRLALGGSGVLTAVFVLCWLAVKTRPLPDAETVFYGIRAGHPPAVLWMNVSMGGGLVYIAAWSLVECLYFLRQARTTYEHVFTGVGMVLYALSGVAGTLTMAEAVGHHQGWDMTVITRVKGPFTLLVTAASLGLWGGQLWLRPLWRQRRQLLARYVAPELTQLRHDLLNLSAAQAALHLDIHQEAYANRAIVAAVVARCQAAGVSPPRVAMARMAASLLTFQRANVLNDPSYDPATSWAVLTEEAAAEIDKVMALTAWEKALRESYVSQHVYILMFLVLDSPAYREQLLIDERPRVEAWHQQVADLIATVMHEHGHATPRYVAMARRETTPHHHTTWRQHWKDL